MRIIYLTFPQCFPYQLDFLCAECIRCKNTISAFCSFSLRKRAFLFTAEYGCCQRFKFHFLGFEVVFDSSKGNHKSFSPLEDKYRFPSLYCHALVPDFYLMIQFRVTKYNKRAGETKPTSSLEHVRSHFMFTTFNHATITVVDLMLNKIHSS